LWDAAEGRPKQDISRYVRIGIFAAIGLVIFGIVSGRSVIMLLNLNEFQDLFTKPVYYGMLSALILSSIALIRVDIRKRESLVWWIFSIGISFFKREALEQTQVAARYHDFKLSRVNFAIWQVTKVLLLAPLFSNLMFGIATQYVLEGKELGLYSLPNIFYLPFITSPDPTIAKELVIPMVPSLTMLIPALLGAIGIRLVLYVGLRNLAHIISSYIADAAEGRPKFLFYMSIIELIIGAGLFWSSFNMFFTSHIDYNTKYAIVGSALLGAAFITWSIIDKGRSKVIIFPSRKNVYLRLLTIVSIAVIVGSIMAVNNSIADAKKIEYLGPYTAQQIAVNRYFADMDEVKEINYEVKLFATPSSGATDYIKKNEDLLSKIRLWDWTAGFAKLKPEIGLIPYVDFETSDIIRFNNTLYWAASMKPILPSTVTAENTWYNEHLVYTHVPNGFLMLDAHNGDIVNSDKFFQQRRIYYGEGGLLSEVWAAFPANRQTSDELGSYFYNGNGGITVPPPLSWMFESNFLLSYPDKAIHIIRYRDIHDRMALLYPYFEYDFGNRQVDTLPVTDGSNTYWLMPLIVRFDTSNVPWSADNPMYRLVGYALIDVYNGKPQILIKGNDFFTNMFANQYPDRVTREIPAWLHNQLRYPEELFWWKANMYNFYHVKDPSTFIVAKEFFEIPEGLSPYYIFAKPPGFDKPEYLALLSLELKGAAGRNLAGYMVMRNDYPHDGEIIFYEVPLESETKLLGPSAVIEALDRDPDFAQLKTLLRNPRIGDNIFYRVGDQDVYFIPVYTAGAGGVVSQLGTIAAVGAAFTGEYHVGLGQTAEEAFKAYLAKLSGVNVQPTTKLDRTTKINNVLDLFEKKELHVMKPTAISVPLTFQENQVEYNAEGDLENVKKTVDDFIAKWATEKGKRILEWEQGDNINFGVVIVSEGIPEVHYIAVKVGT